MKKILMLLLLTAYGLNAQSERIDLGSHGKLALYLSESWKIHISDFGDRQIVTIEPAGEANASCVVTITFPENDSYDTKARLKQRTEIEGVKYAEQSVEGKARAKEFSLTSGYGFYCNFTDPSLVGQPPQKGNFKTISVGLIRLAPDVLVEVAINADGFMSEPYQQLFGMIEGMEFTASRAR